MIDKYRPIAIMAVVVATLGMSQSAGAERFEMEGTALVQRHWQPNRYRMFCGAFPNAARAEPCFEPDIQRRLENTVAQAMVALRSIEIGSPAVFGPVRATPASDGQPHVRLFDNLNGPANRYASVDPPCLGPPLTTMRFGPNIMTILDRPHLVTWVAAHELTHAIQFGYRGYLDGSCEVPPAWLGEAIADAVGTAVMRQGYPDLFPYQARKWAGRVVGLRPYDRPLNLLSGLKTGGKDRLAYKTSSFWRHLAEVYHQGRYGFIARYLEQLAGRSGNGQRDWLHWLNINLEDDPAVAAHLSMVYAGFVADFASWHDRGLPGDQFSGSEWLESAFGGCERVTIDPAEGQAVLSLTFKRLSARCVRLRVEPLAPEDRVAVKIGVVAGEAEGNPPATFIDEEALVDQFYLALADTTDRSGFNCARAVRQRGRQALGECLFTPDTGRVKIDDGPMRDARIWQAVDQEAGRGTASGTQRVAQASLSGFTNTYLLSRAPVYPREPPSNKQDGGDEITARIFFLLDHKTLAIDGSHTKTLLKSKNAGKKGVTRTKATLGMVPLKVDDNVKVPMVTQDGYKTRSLTRPGARSYSMNDIDVGRNRLTGFTLARVRSPNPDKLRDSGWWPLEHHAVLLQQPLALGDLGTFEAMIVTTGAGDTTGTRYRTLNGAPAMITVREFSPRQVRATIDATLCRFAPPPAASSSPGDCVDPHRIEGTVSKPFAAAYLRGSRFVVEDTPGTRIYRGVNTRAEPLATDPQELGEPPENGPSVPENEPQTAGSTNTECTCNCREYERLQATAERLEDGDVFALFKLKEVTLCMQQCFVQYRRCQ